MGIAREKKTKKERENGQVDPKIHMKVQGSQNSQTILKNKKKSRKTDTSQFHNLLQTKVLKTVWYWPKYRHTDNGIQWRLQK